MINLFGYESHKQMSAEEFNCIAEMIYRSRQNVDKETQFKRDFLECNSIYEQVLDVPALFVCKDYEMGDVFPELYVFKSVE